MKAKEEMRLLTLNMAAQQELEETQAEILGKMTSPTQNRNHERSKKYQHPKVCLTCTNAPVVTLF